jgi:integrase
VRLNLYKRGDVWWVRGSGGGVKFRKSTRYKSRSKAERVRDRWEREIADPTHFRAHQATVESAALRWLREIRATMKPETVRFYEVKLAHVRRVLGKVRLAKVDHDRVLKYIEQREVEGAHSHSVHRELTALRLTLKSAQRAKEFTGDPKATIPRYKAGYVPQTGWVTPEQVWAAIAHLPPHRGAAVAFAIATACDTSNIFLARREDVTASRVLVRGTKTTTRTRWVPRVGIFAEFLSFALKHAEPGPAELLFAPWVSMPRDIKRACRRAGIEGFNVRELRRSAATWMVRAGVPYEVVAKYLGHGSTLMLQRVYGQLAPEDAGRLIDERMRGATVPPVYPPPVSGADKADRADPRKTETNGKDEVPE